MLWFVSLVFVVLCHVFCYLLPLVLSGLDRLSNDVVHVRHWWFRRGGTFIRTALPVFNVQLIVGLVTFGLRAPGSLLRPMIKLA